MKKTTACDNRQLLFLCKMSSKSSSAELTKQWQFYDVNVSSRTTRRRLVEQGYLAYRPTVKAFLNNAVKKKHIEWALKYRDWTAKDWSRVCFSEESLIEIMKECPLFVDVALNVIYRSVQFQK